MIMVTQGNNEKYIGIVQKVLKHCVIQGYKFYYFKHINNWNYDKGIIELSRDQLLNGIISNRFYPINCTVNNRIVVKSLVKEERTIRDMLKTVRKYLEDKYGTGTNLTGHCIEASELVILLLKSMNYRDAKAVEGWCSFDDEYYGSDRPYDPHTWVECGKYYIDVTADQFNPGMWGNHQFKPVIFKVGLPHGMSYTEPVVYE